MKDNADMSQSVKLTVGSEIVGDLDVVVYEIPKSNILCWVSCGIFAALGFSGSIGTSLAFRKKANVWETGHVIIV